MITFRCVVPGSFSLFLFLAAFLPFPAFAVDCSVAETAIEIARSIRGLRLKHEVPCKVQSKEEVRAYLRKVVDTKIPKEKLESEERIYKLLGVLPVDFDYVSGLVRLYSEQVGGYYDTDARHYVMAAWMPASVQMPIAVHELTHALQDQHYELAAMVEPGKFDTDALLARSALIEGDATAVMLDYSRSITGQGSIADEPSVSAFLMQNILGSLLSSSVNEAPPALQSLMIFPYVSGLHFTHFLLKQGGYAAVDSAFRRLPNSTSEILHPERYASRTSVLPVIPVPELPSRLEAEGAKLLTDDRLGEFFIANLLGLWISPVQASKAANGWAGDRIALYETEGSGHGIVIWDTRWASEKEAEEFFTGLLAASEKRFQSSSKTDSAGRAFIVNADAEVGNFELTRRGTTVLVAIGK